MRDSEIHAALRILGQEVRQWQEPVLGVVARESRDPFQILIACVLSLRTKDQTTTDASRRLFALASTPSTMRRLSRRRIEAAIYPVGFYRTKAKHIREICRRLLERYGGSVPDSVEELLTLPGRGRKTANLVVTVGYGKPGICVDTHVHRISNRWGYVKTKRPRRPSLPSGKNFRNSTGSNTTISWFHSASTFAGRFHRCAADVPLGSIVTKWVSPSAVDCWRSH